jgi:cytochrome c-type biogenesis protein CcmH/NrfG
MRHTTFRTFIVSLSFFLAVCSALGQVHSSTQPIEIRGQLRYALGGAPAANVLVRLESMSGGAVTEDRTDNLGKFRFSNLVPIQYFVYIRQPGFKEIQREVNLVMIPSDYIQLQLVPENPVPGGASISSAKLVDANVPAAARKEFEKAEVAFLNNKKINEGINHLEKAIQIYPNFVEAALRLGTAYMDLEQWDKAEEALKRALEIDPKAANVQFALGAIYLQQRRFDDAEKALLKSLAIENRSWQGHFTLGRVYWTRNASGDLLKAGRQIALTLQLNPRLAEAHLLAGNILLRANKRDDAMMEFQEYLRLAPKGEFAAQARETVQKIKQSQGQK